MQKPVYTIEKISSTWYRLNLMTSTGRRVYWGYTLEHVKSKAGLR